MPAQGTPVQDTPVEGAPVDSTPSDTVLYLYGDAGHFLSYGVMCPYSSRRITSRQDAANIELPSARIVVEWAFGLVTSQFGYGDKKRAQQIGLSPIGAYYIVAVLLTNCQTCINQRNRFNNLIHPSSLEKYLCIY